MKKLLLLGAIYASLFSTASAQFTGPAAVGQASTVAQARTAGPHTYVTVSGNVIAHLHKDYFTFRDQTGEVRVEIEPEVWRGRKVGPETNVRLSAEVDRDSTGTVYLSVESLDIAN
jgi:uncharacterized protein (TIGR00156 family)